VSIEPARRTPSLWFLVIPVALALWATVLVIHNGTSGRILGRPATASERFSSVARSIDQPPLPSTIPLPSTVPRTGFEIHQPRVLGDSVVLAAAEGFRGYDLVTGDQIWSVPCDSALWASPVPGTNPDIDVGTCNDEFVAIDARNRRLLWRRPLSTFSDRIRVGPTCFVMQSDTDGVQVHDLMTGAELWSDTSLGSANVAPSDRFVYVSTDTGLTARSIQDGTTQWMQFLAASGLAATNDALFARTNVHEVARLDLLTGVVQTKSDPDTDALLSSDIVDFTDDVIVLMSTRGNNAVSVYDRATLRRLWVADSPGQVAVAAQGSFVSIANGLESTITTYDAISGTPVRVDRHVLAVRPDLNDGRLYLLVQDGGDAHLEVKVVR
jgi:outer membrane protein assembly factor BamB